MMIQNGDKTGSRFAVLFWSLLVISTGIRLVYAVVLPLTGDEAYFWEWARHPALSYYDHPPMAAWVMWPLIKLFGNTQLAVRMGAIIGIPLVILITRRLTLLISGSTKTANLTGILAMGIPLLEVGGLIYTTDTPLVLAGTMGGYLFYQAVVRNRKYAWWGLGVCFAAAILSKFLGVGLIAACFGYLLLSPKYRFYLRKSGPYIALGIGALGLVPILIWNASHNWATFVFNFSSRQAPLALGLTHLADYLAGQALALSPVVFLLAFPALAVCFPPGRNAVTARWEIPAFLALVPLGGFLAISVLTKVDPQWTGIGVPFLAIAVAGFLLRGEKAGGYYIGAAATAWTISLLIFLIPILPLTFPEGWKSPIRPDKIKISDLKLLTASPSGKGAEIAANLKEMEKEGATFVFTRSYALSSLAAFYTPGNPEVTVLGPGSVHGRSHFSWFDPSAHTGENALFVSYRDFAHERKFLLQRFKRVVLVLDASLDQNSLPLTLVKCYGFSGKR
ncbi:MAG: glycosyltransferase family 39 protein [Deltaproteobacteria bacterium]|nr:glycosyltransferase family 39 protein [Deltaproteobacteria bacterium]